MISSGLKLNSFRERDNFSKVDFEKFSLKKGMFWIYFPNDSKRTSSFNFFVSLFKIASQLSESKLLSFSILNSKYLRTLLFNSKFKLFLLIYPLMILKVSLKIGNIINVIRFKRFTCNYFLPLS